MKTEENSAYGLIIRQVSGLKVSISCIYLNVCGIYAATTIHS